MNKQMVCSLIAPHAESAYVRAKDFIDPPELQFVIGIQFFVYYSTSYMKTLVLGAFDLQSQLIKNYG